MPVCVVWQAAMMAAGISPNRPDVRSYVRDTVVCFSCSSPAGGSSTGLDGGGGEARSRRDNRPATHAGGAPLPVPVPVPPCRARRPRPARAGRQGPTRCPGRVALQDWTSE
jgi:hypothetical protein